MDKERGTEQHLSACASIVVLSSKGQVIRETFSFNLWRNIVALQVERVVATEVDPSSTFWNKFFQLATLKFVAWQVEHAVVIRATTLFNLQCNSRVARQVE